MFVAMAAVSFASCGGNQKANTTGNDSDTITPATVDGAAVAGDTTYNAAKDTMFVTYSDGKIDTIKVEPAAPAAAPAAEDNK